MEARSIPKGVTALKIYFIILGIIYVVMGLILPPAMMTAMRAAMEAAAEFGAAPVAFGGIGFVWGFFLVCWGIFMIIIGPQLGQGRGWARIAAIVVGILSLPHFPVGTVLGILCLVILFGQEGKAYFITRPESSPA